MICFKHAVSRSLDRNEALYNGLYEENLSLSLPAFNNAFTAAYFYESRNTPMENELFTILVNTVVIATEIISELILRMLNGSSAQLILFTVRTIQGIYSLFFSAKFVQDENRKIGNKLVF